MDINLNSNDFYTIPKPKDDSSLFKFYLGNFGVVF